MRSMGRVDSRPYPDSEESDDDVIYAEEYESELQQINLRNEAPNQITVDTCGERCARTTILICFCRQMSGMKSLIPRSRRSTHQTAGMVFMWTPQTRPPSHTETTTHRLSAPPVVTQTRPKGGCQTAMPRRVHWRRNRTVDNTSAADTRIRHLMYSWF